MVAVFTLNREQIDSPELAFKVTLWSVRRSKKCQDIRNLQKNKSMLINNIIGTVDRKSRKIKAFFFFLFSGNAATYVCKEDSSYPSSWGFPSVAVFYILSGGAENCSLSLATCKISNRCFGCVWLKGNELGLFHFVSF